MKVFCSVILAVAILLLALGGAQASAASVERSDTESFEPAEVEAFVEEEDGGDRIVLDSAPDLEIGDPVVVPISPSTPHGLLGVATHVHEGADGEVAVETKPTQLARAYSSVDLPRETLSNLYPNSSLAGLLADKFACTGSAKVTGPQIKPGLGSLAVSLHLRPHAYQLRVAGRPEIRVNLSADAEAKCHYDGDLGFPIVVPGTPVLIKLSPVPRFTASGSFSADFSWRPELEVGVEKRSQWRKRRASLSLTTLRPDPPALDAEGTASLFLGFKVSLSVAGALGLEGTAGPRIKVEGSSDNDSTCVRGTPYVDLRLRAFAKVLSKSWRLPIHKSTHAVGPVWEGGDCEANSPPTARPASGS